MVERVVGAAVLVEVMTFSNCSPAVLAEVIAVDAMVVAAVVAAPNTLPECLRVCLRITSGDETNNLFSEFCNITKCAIEPKTCLMSLQLDFDGEDK